MIESLQNTALFVAALVFLIYVIKNIGSKKITPQNVKKSYEQIEYEANLRQLEYEENWAAIQATMQRLKKRELTLEERLILIDEKLDYTLDDYVNNFNSLKVKHINETVENEDGSFDLSVKYKIEKK